LIVLQHQWGFNHKAAVAQVVGMVFLVTVNVLNHFTLEMFWIIRQANYLGSCINGHAGHRKRESPSMKMISAGHTVNALLVLYTYLAWQISARKISGAFTNSFHNYKTFCESLCKVFQSATTIIPLRPTNNISVQIFSKRVPQSNFKNQLSWKITI